MELEQVRALGSLQGTQRFARREQKSAKDSLESDRGTH